MSSKCYFRFENTRPGQDSLIKEIIQAIREKKHLIVQAPTGIGKTDATISGALTDLNKKTIFFLTPKKSQHEIVLESIKGLNDKFDLDLKAIDLVGKKDLCTDPFLSETPFGFYELCSIKRNSKKCKYYNNLIKGQEREHSLRELKKLPIVDFKEFKKNCALLDEKLCAYETALVLGRNANIIIGNYLHIFDPKIRKLLLKKTKKKLSEIVLVIDEAHNLAEKVREINSKKISINLITQNQKILREQNEKILVEKLEIVKEYFKKLSEKVNIRKEAILTETDLDELIKKQLNGSSETLKFCSELMKVHSKLVEEKPTSKSSLPIISEFFTHWLSTIKSDQYVRKIESNENKTNFILKIASLNSTSDVFNEVHSAILMSGTMLPLKMHQKILGLNEEKTNSKYFTSPFPKENRLMIIDEETTTKFTERSETEFRKIAKKIETVANKTPGNVAVFFPSFKIMNEVYFQLNTNLSKPILKQVPAMKAQESKELLSKFKTLGYGFGSILLGVLGGLFSEGIDYIGNQLKGVIIVGIPFSEPNIETKALIEFYEKKFKNGWEYAYTAPAINKTLQAAGRCIRSEKDRGIIILLDKRYSWQNYLKCLPSEEITRGNIEEKIENFWN